MLYTLVVGKPPFDVSLTSTGRLHVVLQKKIHVTSKIEIMIIVKTTMNLLLLVGTVYIIKTKPVCII